MKPDDELWMKKMKEMLQDYDEPSPPGSWERINKTLTPPVERKLLTRKWWGAVAAVLLLAVSGISFYFLNTPVAEEVRMADVPVVESLPSDMPIVPQLEVAVRQIIPAKEVSSKKHIAQVRIEKEEKNILEEPIVEKIPFVDEQSVANTDDTTVDDKTETEKYNGSDRTNRNESSPVVRNSSNNTTRNNGLGTYGSLSKKSSRKNWAVGVSVNSGTAALLNDDKNTPVYVNKTTSLSINDLADVTSNSTGFIDLTDKNIMYKEGVPQQVAESTKMDHQLPITVGLSLRKEITNSFSLETGVTYTFLKSDVRQITQQSETKKGEQKLHYIGIPVRANWDFISSKNFTVYATAGGMVEKCVYGKTLDEENTVKPLQFSLNGGVGAQYNISKLVGLYVEPGVSYFFDDGSKVETIRKENPFNFNLQAGVRFTY